ncbi:MAG: DnaJ domain-containing protein [Devosiaceae bacterium]|nr:DnaJ domain-containing protein [Devosiaceae bacterium MH13]
MIWLIFGLAALAIFLTLGNALSRVPAAQIAKGARFGGIAVLVGLAGLLMLTGRFHMVSQVLALAGQAMRHRRAFAGTKGFEDIDAAAKSGEGPSIKTAYLAMQLDEATGAIDGRFTAGPHAGRPLSSLGEADLVNALSGVSDDPESVRLLEAYLDRAFAGWRENHDERLGARSARTPDTSGMAEDEAYEILGLEPGADAEAIRSAHRRLMANIHPDRGGSTYLAAKVNLAKEVLLKLHG